MGKIFNSAHKLHTVWKLHMIYTLNKMKFPFIIFSFFLSHQYNME